ncbi:MAG: YIP1 family protein [Candidatus Bipolaricaulota bacterium]|nr:YIP1 family protein [Candidatus Bipolaricaulota bacterium]MDW8030497.1 Yip1 family protein [Candidatus Bipolaricaulota bacterium]
MQESETKPPRLKGWEMVLGTILDPAETLRYIADECPWGDALGLILIASILGYGVDSLLPSGDQFSLSGMISNVFYALFSYVVFVGLVHVIGQQWYDEGDYEGAFCALAFTSVPFIFFSLISILILPLGIQPPSLDPRSWTWGPKLDPGVGIFTLLLAIATLVWIIILNVIAIREHYDLENGEAIITYILARVIDIVIFWILEGIFK